MGVAFICLILTTGNVYVEGTSSKMWSTIYATESSNMDVCLLQKLIQLSYRCFQIWCLLILTFKYIRSLMPSQVHRFWICIGLIILKMYFFIKNMLLPHSTFINAVSPSLLLQTSDTISDSLDQFRHAILGTLPYWQRINLEWFVYKAIGNMKLITKVAQ